MIGMTKFETDVVFFILQINSKTLYIKKTIMFYKITLTASGGLEIEQVNAIIEYFKECQYAYIVNEFGESGLNSHLEGIVEFESKKTSNISDRIKRLYGKLDIEFVEGVTIRVKAATHLIGALIYCSKELKLKGNVLLLRGWEQSWIDKQVKDNVKNIPHSMLTKKGTKVTQGTGGALMHEWVKANNRQCNCSLDFFNIVEEMGDQGYKFGSIRYTGLMVDLCALLGSGKAARRAAENECRWIEF